MNRFWTGVSVILFAAGGALAAEKAAPSSGVVEKGGFIWGMNGHPLGGGGVYSDRGVGLEQQFALLKELGTTWYRFDVFARDPHNGGGPEWRDELDTIVPAAESAGIQMYPILYPPIELRPYETLPGRKTTEEIYKLCYDHAKSVATKWRGRIKVWDLLNEPDGWVLKAGHGLSKEEYDPALVDVCAAILTAQSNGLRDGDPDVLISFNIGGWLHTGLVDLMIGRGLKFDILSWHWYSDMKSIREVRVGDTTIPLLDKLLAYGKPIWIGEFNVRPKDQAARDAGWLTKTTNELYDYRDRGVEAIFYYELLDLSSLEGDPGYGFIDVERTLDAQGQPNWRITEPKPEFREVQRLIAEKSSGK